jgi:hypothetical protein
LIEVDFDAVAPVKGSNMFGIYQQALSFSNPRPLQGEETTIAANVFNFGTIGMANVPVDLYIDSNKVATATVSFIPALSNQTIDFDWIAVRGIHNITIVVNGGQSIPESDYSNNQVQTSITVLADDVAIASVTKTKSVVGQGFSFNMSVTAANDGDFTETFNVTAYANTTPIGTQEVSAVPSGDSTQLVFMWNTTGFAYGNYTLSATADTVPGETDTPNNNFACSVPVHVGVPGYVSSSTLGVYDGVTNMKDIAYLVSLFNTRPSSSSWNPNADVNNDGVVNMKDIAIAVLYFNQHE